MNRSLQGPVGIGIVVVAVGLGAWTLSGADHVPVEGQSVKAPVAASADRSPAATKATRAAVGPLDVPKARSLDKEAQFEFAAELDQYLGLRRKVFLTDTDRAYKQTLFLNHRFIDGLATYLRRPSGSDLAAVAQQGAAIDFLLEALTSQQASNAAESALRDVILDNQVEDARVDLKIREGHAGVKSEVLYKWTATEPQRASEIEAWLPGSVSRKIWANVLEAQDRNVKESIVIGQTDQ